jgi:hypothetical protein
MSPRVRGGRRSASQSVGLLAAACMAGTVPAPADPVADTTGIWKAVVPPAGVMHGEFGSDDPVGLAAGVRIPADCSINWVDPDGGRLYCFATATSLVVFLDTPRSYLRAAEAQWRRLGGGTR